MEAGTRGRAASGQAPYLPPHNTSAGAEAVSHHSKASAKGREAQCARIEEHGHAASARAHGSVDSDSKRTGVAVHVDIATSC